MDRELLDEFGNATADFLRQEVVGTETDAHGDEHDVTEWQAGHTDVTVRYEESAADRDAGGFAVKKTGYDEVPIARLFAPGVIGEDYREGDRVRLHYRGQTTEYRMDALDHKTPDMSDDGFVLASLSDFGDGA